MIKINTLLLARSSRNRLKMTPATSPTSWVLGYDPKMKQQQSHWKTPTSLQLKKARQGRSNVSFFLIDIVHKEFVPSGQMVNGKLYCNILRQLRDNIRCECPDIWCDNSWALHYDNALAHASLVVQQFFAFTNTTVIPHPPHSLDLSPCDFFLFLKMKLKLKGRCFDSIEEIQTNLQDMMETLM